MSIEMRPVTPEEFDTFVTATFIGFGAPVAPPEDTANTKALCEYDRTLASFDGEEIVSTTGVFSFDMTVPGGSLSAAGVTWVAVKPTYRRKGLLTNMMKQQLSDVRDRNEPIAALWAIRRPTTSVAFSMNAWPSICGPTRCRFVAAKPGWAAPQSALEPVAASLRCSS